MVPRGPGGSRRERAGWEERPRLRPPSTPGTTTKPSSSGSPAFWAGRFLLLSSFACSTCGACVIRPAGSAGPACPAAAAACRTSKGAASPVAGSVALGPLCRMILGCRASCQGPGPARAPAPRARCSGRASPNTCCKLETVRVTIPASVRPDCASPALAPVWAGSHARSSAWCTRSCSVSHPCCCSDSSARRCGGSACAISLVPGAARCLPEAGG